MPHERVRVPDALVLKARNVSTESLDSPVYRGFLIFELSGDATRLPPAVPAVITSHEFVASFQTCPFDTESGSGLLFLHSPPIKSSASGRGHARVRKTDDG